VGEASNGEDGLMRLRMVDYEAVLLDYQYARDRRNRDLQTRQTHLHENADSYANGPRQRRRQSRGVGSRCRRLCDQAFSDTRVDGTMSGPSTGSVRAPHLQLPNQRQGAEPGSLLCPCLSLSKRGLWRPKLTVVIFPDTSVDLPLDQLRTF
jgi:hypothetical protein